MLHINAPKAAALSEEEVVDRWMRLFKGHMLVSRFVKNQCASDAEREKARELIEVWRERLMDISWFMRCLNEHIARKANEEDGCKGRFWEGRFKSQALLDEKAVLACMVYVDLNPIRAKLAETPEQSDNTSIQQRINEVSQPPQRPTHMESKNQKPSRQTEQKKETKPAKPPLLPFSGGYQEAAGIPYHGLADYIELVDWSRRVVVPGKRGAIAERLPAILARLGFDETDWSGAVNGFNKGFHDFIGGSDALQRVCDNSSRSWIRGSRACRQVFNQHGRDRAA